MKGLKFALKATGWRKVLVAVLGGALMALGVPADDIWWSQLIRLTVLMGLVAGFITPPYRLYRAVSMGPGVWRKHVALNQFALAAVCAAIAWPIFTYFSVGLWLLLVFPAIAGVHLAASYLGVPESTYEAGALRYRATDLEGTIQDGWRSAVPTDEKKEIRNNAVIFPIMALVLASLDWALHVLVGIDLGGLLFSPPALVSGLLIGVSMYAMAIAVVKRGSFQWWIEMGGSRWAWCRRQYGWMLALLASSFGTAAIFWAYNYLLVGLDALDPTVMGCVLLVPAMAPVTILIAWLNFAIRNTRELYLSNAVLLVVLTVSTAVVLRMETLSTSMLYIFLWHVAAPIAVIMVFRRIHRVNPFGTFRWEKTLGLRTTVGAAT